jgi:hypothetical protein
MLNTHDFARLVIWLVLIVCGAALFGVLSLVLALMPIDTGEDVADYAIAGILRGAA